MDEFVRTCERAARAGGEQLKQWRGRFKVHEKGPADLVTEADLASQDAIYRVISEAYPDHDFLGEEDTDIQLSGSPFVWHADPLDGTTNYVHGVAPYCVSVALAEEGELIAAAVYDPVLDECFTAQCGGGAFLNRERMAVSGTESLGGALVVASFPPGVGPHSEEIQGFLRVLQSTGSMRRTGSAALNLCYVAAGRFDAFWAVTIKSWDVAAGVLLVREAGGTVTAPDGGPFVLSEAKLAAAASEQLHGDLLTLLKSG